MKKICRAIVLTSAALAFTLSPITPGNSVEKVEAAEFKAQINMLRYTNLNLMGGLTNIKVITGTTLVSVDQNGMVSTNYRLGTAVIVGYDTAGNSLTYTVNVVTN